jgi:phage terminase small subunit
MEKVKKTTKKQIKPVEAPPKKTATKPKKQDEPLTEKEEQLCREYVCDFAGNQVRAYMHVYPGSKYDTAKTQACRLFTKHNIKLRIAELRAERNKRLEITGDRVLSEIAKLAFYDPRGFFDDDMRLKPISELDPDHAAIIAGIETLHKTVGEEKDGQVVLTKIKLPDKGSNLERLGKYLKLFVDRVEHTGQDGGPIKTQELSDAELLNIATRSSAGTSQKKKSA